MGNLCSKGVSGNAAEEGGFSVTPSPAPPLQGAGDEGQSSQSTPYCSAADSPWPSVTPPGITPSPSPAAASGTPRGRCMNWPFHPPSPAKPITCTLLRRRGRATPPPLPIPENAGGGVRALDKRFGYANNFSCMFELGMQLGRGNYGQTCVAKALTGDLKNQHVAVKIISKTKMTTALSIEDVRREIKILKALSGQHPNMVQFYDAFEDEQNVFIVMELCEGGALYDALASRYGGRYHEEDAKRVVVQMLNSLAYIHLQGVVHRDLKPENFVFDKRGDDALIKVIDFGLSDYIRPGERLSDMVGSAYYVAPEVLHRSYTVDADMWSLGVIVYILLCGGRPFWGRNEAELFGYIMREEPNLHSGPWRGISVEAKDFVQRLLVKDHQKRMTAAQALAHPWLSSENPVVPLDIFMFISVKSYVEATPLRRAALKALSKTLTEQQLVYLWAQFQHLEPTDGYVSFVNFLVALLKNMTDVMRESRTFDISSSMSNIDGQMEFEEFCAAAISPIQLEALENWEEMARTAYKHFLREWKHNISSRDIAEVENLGPLIPSIVKQWVRSDDNGKLSFIGYTKILHGSSVHDPSPGARLRRRASRNTTALPPP